MNSLEEAKLHIKKMKIYSYYQDGTFEDKDKNRLKPMSRLRPTIEETKDDGIGQKVKDWYQDIDRGYSK